MNGGNMKNRFFGTAAAMGLFFFAFWAPVAQAQILTFDFAGLAGNEATANSNTKDANLATSTISRGAGLTASANGDRFNATGWAVSSIANAVSGNDYVEFTITPNAGYQFSVSTIAVQWQRSAAGNTAISLRSSANSYATDIDSVKAVTDSTSTQTFTWNVSQANSTAAVTYRLYSYAENVTGTGGPGDGSGNDITVNGTVTASSAAEPATQATSVSFSSVASTSMDVSWTSGDGANRLVICRSGSAPSSGPVDGTSYTADASFSGSGTSLGGGKVVYAGSGSSFSLSGLTASTTYYLQVYEYNGSGATANYLTSAASGNPNSQATTAPAFSTASDIIRATAFTEPSNVDYASYQATDITSGNSLEVARFTIRDGGASADADSASTTLDAIAFTVANSASLRRVALYDGSTEIAEVAGGATLTYSGLSGLVAADGGTKDLSLRATFVATVTDNQQFSFTVNSATANSGGSTFAAADAGAAASSTTSDRNRIEVTASKLVFTSVPASVNVAQNFTASVAARDANDNLDLDSTASVTIGKATGSGSLTGGTAQNLVAGALSFAGLQIDTSGTITIEATATGLTAATSGSIIAVGKPLAISGYMANPAGASDGPYEYVQVIALENIDFSVNPMSLVWANNGTATANGWINGGTVTYKFNITSGSMNEGDVAYIGGSAKLINGVSSTDISGQTWLRAINTATTAGDGFGTSGGTSGNMGNGGGNADGIAIFNGTTLTDASVPVDALLYGTGIGSALVSSGADGYVLPNNDFYSGGFVQSSSTLVAGDPAAGAFVKLSGTFNTITKTWTVSRTASVVSSPTAIGDIATGILVTAPATEPSTQASTIIFSSVTSSQMTVSWTSGSGANRLVVARAGSAPSSGPVDGTVYSANSDFSAGGSALGGGKVVYAGSGSSFTLTGLDASTTYYLQVYEYNGTGANANFLTTSASGNPASQITADPPNSSVSDIVRASGFTEPSNVAYASYQATDITDVNSIELARFTIRDGGATTDADALTTTLEAISFTVANGSRLRRVALYDGTSEIAEVAGGATVSFTGLSGLSAADGGTKNFSVRATFTASVTDNQQLSFTVASASATPGNSEFAAANAGGAVSDTTGDANRLEVSATKLSFSTVPSSVTIAQNFTAVVQARDALDNVDLDDSTSVTIIKGSGSGTLTGGGAQSLSSGAQTWSTLQMDETGSFTLQASGGSLSAAVSGSISAYPGPTTLAAGDIAIIGYNSGTTPDELVILVTKDLGPGTVFYVNDNEVSSAGGTTFTDLGETENSFTVKAGQIIPAGTVFVLPWGGSAVSTSTYDWTGNSGGLAANSDEFYIYTAANINSLTPSAFIYGAEFGSGTGQRPIGLIAGTTWINPPPSGTANASRYKIAGATYTATTNAILAAIGDVANNWETAASYTMADTDWTFTFLTPASQPTVQASDIGFASVLSTQIDASWTSGNGANRLVICRQGSAPSASPVDGTAYTADGDFTGGGSSLGGGKVVYDGSDSSFTVTGLDPSTTYYLQVFEYNGAASTINYLTTTATGNPNGTTTDAAGNSTDSDIARASGFTEPENIAYHLYQGADLELVNSIELARFTIRDGAGGADADALATTLTDISFTVSNPGSLRRVAIYDGSSEIAEIAGGGTLTFAGLAGLSAADGSTKEFSLRATFNSSVTDNQQFSFTVNSATAAAGLSLFASANAGGAASSTSGDRNRIEVTATKLVFSSVPASAGVGATFSATVQARDANDSVDLDNTASVTITKASGSGTLSGGSAQSLVSGAQTWASLAVDTAGSVTLQAAGGSLTAATSATITIANSLSAGDVSFVAFNSDGDDDFAIVFWKDVDANTVLYFNDNEWNGSAFTSGEGSFAWNSGGSIITSGTVVRFSSLGLVSRSASVGTISGFSGLDLSGSGEGLFCYRGTSVSAPTAFLAAIGNGTVATSFSSLSGTGLTDGDTAIRLTSGSDIGQYKGARDGYLAVGYRALLSVMSNWDLQDDSGNQHADSIVPDVPFSTTVFTFSSLATEPTTQASGINFSGVTSSQINVAWTSGNGANRLVIARAGSAPSGNPVDGTAYTADASYAGAGSALGSGKVVYIGSGSSFTLTDLDPSTTYHLRVYEYNGSAGSINYLTSTAAGNPNSQVTAASGLSSASDIVRASGFTEPANVAYGSYQATDVTDVNSIELARFTIRDGSGAPDGDSSDTTLTSLALTVANGARLRRVAVYDGATEIAEVAGGATVTFSSLVGLVAADDGTKDFSIRATFNASVTDNQQVQFTVSSITADLGGSTFGSIDGGGASSDITGDANRIEVAATKLTFSYAQTPVLVGQSFTATVQARDALDNVDLDSVESVTITKASGSGTLSGGAAQALSSGALSFGSLQIDAGGSFTLTAAGGALTSATSSSLTAVAALAAGDLALIGRINNASPDSFALLALANIPAGSVVYFTDNGWSNAAPANFRGALSDGDGSETLMRLTVNSTITAGTIFRSTDSDARWTWTTSGSIPFGGAATYSALTLATGGEQIYAFQVANLNTNPLAAASSHIFVLDDTGTFEDPDNSSGSSQGNIPPGLSAGADTALSFPFSSDNVIGLNMALASAQNYATKTEWLDFINNQANWSTSATGLPSGGVAFGLPCPGSTPPRMANPGAKTFTVGTLSSFQVVANDPGCYGVTLSAAGQPAGPSFTTAGNGTNTVGTFSWNPNLGDEGTYLVRFTATDSSALASSLVIRVYVRGIGEATNSGGVPVSQTNWVVDITASPANGANAQVTWSATAGISYDVYYSDNDPSGAMFWTKHGTVLADAATESLDVPEDPQRYYSVVPSGESPTTYGLWGVIKPTIPSGFSMQSVPLDIADRTMSGELGNALKAVLSNGDRVYAMEANGSFTTITLSGGTWDTAYTFAEGQGFFVQSASGATPRFAGPVGNDGSATRTINPGASPTSGRWNILGLSQGKTLSFSSAFATGNFTGTPTADWDETVSDLVVIDQGNGNWKRVMRTGSSTWLDLDTFSTPSVNLAPGSAVYYFHYGNSALSINF
jgi:hypothetical protein